MFTIIFIILFNNQQVSGFDALKKCLENVFKKMHFLTKNCIKIVFILIFMNIINRKILKIKPQTEKDIYKYSRN